MKKKVMQGLTVFVENERALVKLKKTLEKLNYVTHIEDIDTDETDETAYLQLVELSLKDEWDQSENEHWDKFIEETLSKTS